MAEGRTSGIVNAAQGISALLNVLGVLQNFSGITGGQKDQVQELQEQLQGLQGKEGAPPIGDEMRTKIEKIQNAAQERDITAVPEILKGISELFDRFKELLGVGKHVDAGLGQQASPVVGGTPSQMGTRGEGKGLG